DRLDDRERVFERRVAERDRQLRVRPRQQLPDFPLSDFELSDDRVLVHALNPGSTATHELLRTERGEHDELELADAGRTLNHRALLMKLPICVVSRATSPGSLAPHDAQRTRSAHSVLEQLELNRVADLEIVERGAILQVGAME